MATNREEAEEVAEVPSVKPGFTLVVMLSMMLGILLTIGAAGAFFFYQKSQSLQAEVAAARDVLKQKSQSLDEMKAQIEALSRQIHALKEYSIARSGLPVVKEKKAAVAAPEKDSEAKPVEPSGSAEKVVVPETPIPPRVKKPKSTAQNCELVGKSPEEQAATLQRCVGLMNDSTGKSGAR